MRETRWDTSSPLGPVCEKNLPATMSPLWLLAAVASLSDVRIAPNPRVARSRLTRHSSASLAVFSVASSTAMT